MADGTASTRLTHRTSRRVTAGISFHSFDISPDVLQDSSSASETSLLEDNFSCRGLRPLPLLLPTQNITLQFPDDLDPTGGKHGMGVADRRCTFTPCSVTESQVSILTRNGRITGLLGLPRPYRTLTAEVVEVGGGFSREVLGDASVCIAGGTGIAPFLTMGASSSSKKLCWSLRSDDFGAAEFVLQEGLLKAEEWLEVSIFVTSGEDGAGVVAEKPPSWWESTFTTLRQIYSAGKLSLSKGRMAAEDIVVDSADTTQKKTVLFCGSKSLEWQVRIWAMMSTTGATTVYCTEIV